MTETGDYYTEVSKKFNLENEYSQRFTRRANFANETAKHVTEHAGECFAVFLFFCRWDDRNIVRVANQRINGDAVRTIFIEAFK